MASPNGNKNVSHKKGLRSQSPGHNLHSNALPVKQRMHLFLGAALNQCRSFSLRRVVNDGAECVRPHPTHAVTQEHLASRTRQGHDAPEGSCRYEILEARVVELSP